MPFTPGVSGKAVTVPHAVASAQAAAKTPAEQFELAALHDADSLGEFAKDDPRYAEDVFGLEDTAGEFLASTQKGLRPSLWRNPKAREALRRGAFVGVAGGVAGGVFGGVAGGVFGGVVGGVAGGWVGVVGVGVFSGVLGGVAGRASGEWGGGGGGVIAGVGTAVSASFAVAQSNPVLGIVGVLASLALCLGVSIAGNVAGSLKNALPEHEKALQEYEEAQRTAHVLRAHLEDADGIKKKLAEHPRLYLHFLKTVLAKFAQRKKDLLQAKTDQVEILENHEGNIVQFKVNFSDNQELIAAGTLKYEERRSEAEQALKKTEVVLVALEIEGSSIEWEIEQVQRVVEGLKKSQDALQRHAQNWAEAGVESDFARLLSEHVALEVLAIRLAREEIMGEILSRVAADGEVRQITASLDLSEELDRRRKAILVESTRG